MSKNTLTNVKKYFDKFIVKYNPFKNELFYNEFIDFYKDVFIQDAYSNIPNSLVELIEMKNLANEELYDKYLLSNGFSPDLVYSCSLYQKEIILKSLSDYNRYKGSIKSIKNIIDIFQQEVNLYELFINYDRASNKFVFSPYILYKTGNIVELKETLNYSYIANKARRFLIKESDLIKLYNDNRLVLPFKSNIILLDYNKNTDHEYIDNLVLTTVLNYFKNDSITLFLGKKSYNITITGLLQLWFYILYSRYKYDYKKLFDIYNCIILDYTRNDFPYSVSHGEELKLDTFNEENDNTTALTIVLNDFGKIKNVTELDIFFRKYIRHTPTNPNDLYKDRYTSRVYLEILESSLSSINNELLNYVKDLISEDNINYKENADSILLDIKNNLIYWVYTNSEYVTKHLDYYDINTNDENNTYSVNEILYKAYIIKKYGNYIIKLLNSTSINSKNIDESTKTYKLINYFKPIHTDLIYRSYVSISIFDKFNLLFPHDVYYSRIYKNECSKILISDKIRSIISSNTYDDISLSDFYNYSLIKYSKVSEYNIPDDFSKKCIKSYNVSKIVFSSDSRYKKIHEFIVSKIVLNTNSINKQIKIIHDDDLEFSSNIIYKIKKNTISDLGVCDNIRDINMSIKIKDTFEVIDNVSTAIRYYSDCLFYIDRVYIDDVDVLNKINLTDKLYGKHNEQNKMVGIQSIDYVNKLVYFDTNYLGTIGNFTKFYKQI